MAYLAHIPALKEGETEAYHLRPITPDDIPFVAALYERECARSLVACPRPDHIWRHLLGGYSPNSYERRPIQIIENAAGQAVGYVEPGREIWSETQTVAGLAVVEGQSLRAVMPAVLRKLKALAEVEAAAQNKRVTGFRFCLGPNHPLYQAIPEQLPRNFPSYGWYMRVADVPGFIRHIAPALEARLAQSPLAGYSGELKINEYVGGFRLTFEAGRLMAAVPWQRQDGQDPSAGFPPLVFLQLLFGFRSLAELRAAFPDCWTLDEAAALLNVLFPRHDSAVNGLA